MKKRVLFNGTEINVFLSIRSLLLAALVLPLVLSIAACVPTIQKIHHTPVVIGKVIGLDTLQPIAGAIVQHEGADADVDLDDMIEAAKNKIVTNNQGEYHLPSTSSVKAVVLMPGHAITDYPVRISTQNNSALVFASASLLMRDEETSGAPLLIMDPDPETIANTPPGDYLDYKLLRTYLYPHSTLGKCNLGIGGDAISALNTARKAYWRHINDPVVKQEIVDAAYLNVRNVWQYFYNSCDFGDKHTIERRDAIYAVREVTDKIQQEASDLTSK